MIAYALLPVSFLYSPGHPAKAVVPLMLMMCLPISTNVIQTIPSIPGDLRVCHVDSQHSPSQTVS